MTPHPALGSKLAAALVDLSPPQRLASLDQALEALALCSVAGLTGALDSLSTRERRAAVAAGARALLAARGAAARDESLEVALALAEDGLAALRGGGRGRTTSRKGSALHPSATALVSMCRGEPDALAAALVAAHVRGCDDCHAALESSRPAAEHVARAISPAGAPLRVAASTATVRSPADGRRVGRLATPAVEAVLFDDGETRRLAVYGDARVSLRLVGDGLSTEEELAGYWVGRVATGVTTLRAMLHVGEAQVAWKLSLR